MILVFKYRIKINRGSLKTPLSNLKEILIRVLFMVCKIDSFSIIRNAIAILAHFHDVSWFNVSMSNIVDVHEYKTQNWIFEDRKELN